MTFRCFSSIAARFWGGQGTLQLHAVGLLPVIAGLVIGGGTCDVRETVDTTLDPSVSLPAATGHIDAVLPISDRIAAVVVDPVDVVSFYIDDLAGGQYLPSVAEWEATKKSSSPAWAAREVVRQLREEHVHAARTNIELALQEPEAWRIEGARPVNMTAVPIGLDEGRDIGAGEIDWGWVVYLVRSEQQAKAFGGQWDVTIETPYLSGRATWDQNNTISRAIHVNQVGYLRDSSKFAYYGAYLWGLPQELTLPTAASSTTLPFEVRTDGSDAVVWRGIGAVVSTDPEVGRQMHSEEPLWLLDFSEWRPGGNGWYYLNVPSVGRSWPFRVGDGDFVFGEAFYTTARGLFHQRCGQALTSAYTPWTRAADPAHARIFETDYIRSGYGPGPVSKPQPWDRIRFDIIGATLDTSRVTNNVIGDWHDAADWDRNVQHYKVTFGLLYAFELAPEKFSDGQLNIPDSGNGIPDILDEAIWGLQPWIRSMDRKGGVSGMIEAHTHHKFLDPDAQYGFARRERWSTLALCAAAAQAARLLETYGGNWGGNAAAIAQELRSVASATWEYGSDPANDVGTITVNARENRGRGNPYKSTYTQMSGQVDIYMIHAASQMYLLFGQDDLLAGIDDSIKHTQRPGQHPYNLQDQHVWTAFHIARGDVPTNVTDFVLQKWYEGPADDLVARLDGNGYQTTLKPGATALGWGNGAMLNAAEFLLAAYRLVGKEAYREAALRNVDHAFGANPMGMSWTTGIGWSYPSVLQHAQSRNDDIADPVPGITIYGPTGGAFYPELKRDVWAVRDADTGTSQTLWTPPGDLPAWRTWSPHPSLYVPANEFTVHQTMGAPVFVLSELLDSAWQPTEAVRDRGPRPKEELYGRFFLP